MFKWFTLFILSATAVFGTPMTEQSISRCGTTISPESIIQNEAHFAANKDRVVAPKNGTVAAAIVPVYFHVISQDGTEAGGNVPLNVIEDQMNVLNSDFSGTGLSFALTRITRTTNRDWYNIDNFVGPDQTEMKRSLRVSGPENLNIYSVGSIFDNVGRALLGYAHYPASYMIIPVEDGVVLRHGTFPGGNLAPNNEGKTLTHEVGHWVGLYHTFENGCNFPGDYVEDTPYEAVEASGGCMVGRDTCPQAGFYRCQLPTSFLYRRLPGAQLFAYPQLFDGLYGGPGPASPGPGSSLPWYLRVSCGSHWGKSSAYRRPRTGQRKLL